MREARTVIITLLAASVVFAGGGPGTDPRPSGKRAGTVAVPAARTPTALEASYSQSIARVLPSIVQISSEVGPLAVAEGSGIVYDKSGHIVTNDHVVRGAKNFEITLATGGTPRTARLVGSDEASDLAVLKVVDPAGLVPTDFGDSSELSIGEFVLAMGNPLGLSGSVTDGIVSGLDRSVSFPAEPGAAAGSTIGGLIQTSAPIQEGNSGGALIDLAGEVVGILIANVVNTETGATVPGIGFAIPSNTATRVVSQLIKNGKVTDTERATLGVAVQTVVSRRGRPAGVGVLRAAEGTGAPQAAIKPGSVIVSVDGTPTLTAQALAKVLAARKPGHRAKVKLRRPDGSPATTTVTLGKLPAD